MFYDKFIELCEKEGVKPTPLVVSMGLSSSNVSMWKKGSTPRPAIVKKIADYFGVTTDYLLSGEQKEPSQPETEAVGIDNPIYRELLERIAKMSHAKQALVLEKVKEIEKI